MHTTAPPTGRTAPQDLLQLLEKNFREQRPLLDGALLYRGTAVPVQEGGVISNTVMHATLLPKIATQYTHNYGEGQVGFIGAYPLDRNAVFYKDWGMEKALNGKEVEGRTVAQAEELLRPKVAELAAATDVSSRARIGQEIEGLITRELYETALPLRGSGGRAVVAEQLYYYTGQPNAHSNKEALQGMSSVQEHNSRLARDVVFDSYRGKATEGLRKLSLAPGPDGVPQSPTARKALTRIMQVSQAEFSKELRQSYGDLPLKDLVKAATEHPVSKAQSQLHALGGMLKDALQSADPRHQAMGQDAAQRIADLPQNATYREVCGAMAQAARDNQSPLEAPAPAPTQVVPPTHSLGRDR